MRPLEEGSMNQIRDCCCCNLMSLKCVSVHTAQRLDRGLSKSSRSQSTIWSINTYNQIYITVYIRNIYNGVKVSHSPWCEDGIVQEVLKDLSVRGVRSFGLQVLHRFGTGATGALVWPVGVRLRGLGVLLLVSHTCGSDSNGDLQLWMRKKRMRFCEMCDETSSNTAQCKPVLTF